MSPSTVAPPDRQFHINSTHLFWNFFPGSSHSSFPGAILVSQPLDYETCRDYFLTVEARDGGTPPLSAITTVNINITDVNDNAPVFSCQLYTAVVSEDAAMGDSVIQVCFGSEFNPLSFLFLSNFNIQGRFSSVFL